MHTVHKMIIENACCPISTFVRNHPYTEMQYNTHVVNSVHINWILSSYIIWQKSTLEKLMEWCSKLTLTGGQLGHKQKTLSIQPRSSYHSVFIIKSRLARYQFSWHSMTWWKFIWHLKCRRKHHLKLFATAHKFEVHSTSQLHCNNGTVYN